MLTHTQDCKQTRLNSRYGSGTAQHAVFLHFYVSHVLLCCTPKSDQSKLLTHLLLGWWLSLNRRLELA